LEGKVKLQYNTYHYTLCTSTMYRTIIIPNVHW
jgi:hypothetical protein